MHFLRKPNAFVKQMNTLRQLIAPSTTRRYVSNLRSYVDIKPEVLAALQSNGPVVALESTIITHGMPYPHNLDTARAVEDIVRQQNAVPATIAILNGRIKVGLSSDELAELAAGTITPDASSSPAADASNRRPTVKTSRRDLAVVLSKRWNGGTTVAGTLIIADLVGIRVFATGGIGGVHRDGQDTMDISADLMELGRSRLAVVSSGVKSILDIGRTLEYLETQGVCVATFQSEDRSFPAFYTRSSGFKAAYDFTSPAEAAAALEASLRLNLGSGFLIGCAVPESHAMDEHKISNAIEDALKAAKVQGITGKEATPFLLSAISTITQGRSLETNIALIKNNARVAADIAVELSQRMAGADDASIPGGDSVKTLNKVPVVVGASVVDTCYSVNETGLELNGATFQSSLQTSGGGVGRNIAEGLLKLNGFVHLISIIGDDQNGLFLKSLFPAHLRGSIHTDPHRRTGNFAVILDSEGDCKLVLGDMDIHTGISPEMIIKNERLIAQAPIVVMDANLTQDTMATLLDVCTKHRVPVFFEPTDMRRAHLPFQLPRTLTRQIKFTSPNIHELRAIATALDYPADRQPFWDDSHLLDPAINASTGAPHFESIKQAAAFVGEHIDNVLVTLGPLGVLISSRNRTAEHTTRFYAARKFNRIVNVSGAGDSFTSGYIAAMIRGCPEDLCVSVGFEAAGSALMSRGAVPDRYFDMQHSCWKTPAAFETV